MKKKLFKIISCLFGCVAVCGLSLFFLLDNKNKSQKAEAVSINTLANEVGSSSLNINSDSSNAFTLNYSYSISYNRYYDGNISYGFNVMINYYLSFSNNGNTYYVRPQLDNFSTFAIVFESARTNEALTIGSSVELLFNKYYDTYYIWNFLNYGYSWFYLIASNSQVGSYTSDVSSVNYVVDSVGNNQIYDLTSFNTSNRYQSMISYTLSYTLNDYDSGFTDGYNNGFNDGYSSGSTNGYNSGYQQGLLDGQVQAELGLANAYQNGYADGYAEADNQDSTVASIFSGILTVGMLPVNFFLSILNFEILGINLSAFISALLTVALTIIVIKTVTGKGGGGSDK